jgi:protein ERP2
MLNKLDLNLVIYFLITLFIPLYAFDIELTVLVPANHRECFHQLLETGKTIEVEYEVLAGGDLDINYWFYSPTNRVLQSDLKKRDGHQTLKLEETGEYRFCLDNSFSRFSQKQVYFSLRPIYEQGQNENDHITESWMNTIDKDELGDLQSKIQDIKVRFPNLISFDRSSHLSIVMSHFHVSSRLTRINIQLLYLENAKLRFFFLFLLDIIK